MKIDGWRPSEKDRQTAAILKWHLKTSNRADSLCEDDTLNKILLGYAALKTQRNATNHADASGDVWRYDIMIKVFETLIRELRNADDQAACKIQSE